MEKLGYSKILINFIKRIYKNTQSAISNNAYFSNPFPLSRRVRQGYLLCLLLSIINGDLVNLNIKSNDKIVGYPIPNQKENQKLSQCADDINVFVIMEESVVEILKVFQEYEIATGATINISKKKKKTITLLPF